MLLLTIRHRTTYRYRQPVAFGEHRMMLRPRDTADQRVVDIQLAITPEPVSLHSIQDDYGNHIGIAAFSGRANTLSFESTVQVAHAAAPESGAPAADPGYPVQGTHIYDPEDRAALGAFLAAGPAEPEVAAFARRFLRAGDARGTWALLCRLSEGIHRGIAYRRREAKGIQAATETLRLGHGSCRDFAVLMIAAARSLGFAARFASGYLAAPSDLVESGPDAAMDDAAFAEMGGATHAWAQVHLPRLGWIDFDPTSGTVGRRGLITVAVVAVPEEALPLHGTFLGFSGDPVGMDVSVTITPGH